MSNEVSRPVWVEVDLDKIKSNFKLIKENVSRETLIMAIIKANAYGHGIIQVADTLLDIDCDRFGVALPEEGKILREAGFSIPIQVLGEVLPQQISDLLEYDLIPTISKLETVKLLNKLAKKKGITKKIHVKVDTGMGRIGFLPENAVQSIKNINSFTNIEIEGIITHFAKADENNKDYTLKQWTLFNQIIDKLKNAGIDIPIKHVANSATIIDLPEMQLNMVRPGIMIYGLKPSSEIVKDITLTPALSWKAKIVYLKEVPAGTGISYGTSFITSKKTKIATIPLGYADGYTRLLSNKVEVLINGKRASVVGNICMDQFMVDVTHISDVEIGDEVVLIGEQDQEKITANELANKVGTINYEIICKIGNRIPRIYL